MNKFLKTLLKLLGGFLHKAVCLVLAVSLSLMVFLLLPIMQQIAKPPEDEMEVRSLGTVNLPPPPPPPPEEEPEQEEEEPPPPDLADEAPPLDLNQLELALNPGGGGGFGGDFAVDLSSVLGGRAKGQSDEIFSMADLDQKPRVVYQPAPQYPSELKGKNLQGTVHIIFIVDKNGRVQEPKVQKSSHPAFEKPAVQALAKWRFEPGKSGGKPVRFKMRVPITFLSS